MSSMNRYGEEKAQKGQMNYSNRGKWIFLAWDQALSNSNANSNAMEDF